MVVLVWYLVQSDTSVCYFALAYTGRVTFYKVPEQHGHVNLVTLYVRGVTWDQRLPNVNSISSLVDND